MAWVLLMSSAAAAGCGPGRDAAHDPAAARVEVTDAWSRTSAAGARAGVLYLTLKSARGDRLVAVEVPATVARRAELHEVYSGAGGSMSMREVRGVDLPARTAVAFHPGSLHIMLMELAKPLVAGDTLDVTLRFRDARAQQLRVAVRDG